MLLANEVGNATRNANIPVERMNAPMPDQRTKELFLQHDWNVVKAKRLSQLAQRDWRKLQTLDLWFASAGLDIAGMSEEEYEETLVRMSRDAQQHVHPTLASHQLFSGAARNQGRAPEDLADASVLAWGEANHGIFCASLEDMASMQEAALHCDVLTNAGEPQLGLEYWARSARVHGAQGLRCDYASFVNPWTTSCNGKESPNVAAVRESYYRLRPWLQRARQRTGKAQQISDAKPTPKRKATSRKAAAKCTAKGKAARQ